MIDAVYWRDFMRRHALRFGSGATLWASAVCSVTWSMKYSVYRDLSGIALAAAPILVIAGVTWWLDRRCLTAPPSPHHQAGSDPLA